MTKNSYFPRREEEILGGWFPDPGKRIWKDKDGAGFRKGKSEVGE